MEQGGIGLRYHLFSVDVQRRNLARLWKILLPILYTCALQLLHDVLHFGSRCTIYPEPGQKTGLHLETMKGVTRLSKTGSSPAYPVLRVLIRWGFGAEAGSLLPSKSETFNQARLAMRL